MKSKNFIEDRFREIKNKNFLNYRKLHEKEFALFKKDFSIQISEALNNLHKKKYSTKQWKILIGPYIIFFSNILFKNYKTLKKIKKKKIDNTFFLKIKQNDLIMYSMNDLPSFFHSNAFI